MNTHITMPRHYCLHFVSKTNIYPLLLSFFHEGFYTIIYIKRYAIRYYKKCTKTEEEKVPIPHTRGIQHFLLASHTHTIIQALYMSIFCPLQQTCFLKRKSLKKKFHFSHNSSLQLWCRGQNTTITSPGSPRLSRALFSFLFYSSYYLFYTINSFCILMYEYFTPFS